jgi:hypothetical protein
MVFMKATSTIVNIVPAINVLIFRDNAEWLAFRYDDISPECLLGSDITPGSGR